MHGGIAQLGERLNGIQEVSGSIPLISTTLETAQRCGFFIVRRIGMTKPPVKLGVGKKFWPIGHFELVF